MSDAAAGRPAHERAYLALREMVLYGDLAPGQAVTIQGLTGRLALGMTPAREAIRRLISEGALIFQGNRRVSVPQLTRDDMEELVFLRKVIDSELACRAAHAACPAGIADLQRLDDALDTAIAAGDVRGYLRGNYLFHTRLYALASAPVLAEQAERLWLRFGPSLRVVCGRMGTQNLPDWHKDILSALGRGDAQAAADAVSRDVDQGMRQVIAALDPPVRDADSIDRP